MSTKKCSFCSKTSSEVSKLVAGPKTTDDVVYICNECIDIAYNAIHTNTVDIALSNITPHSIKTALDEYVIGQEQAKKTLSVSIYNHMKRISNPVVNGTQLSKSNTIMIGPSGTGKTLLISTLAKLVNVPFTHVDATVYTESGYVGEDVNNIIASLLDACDWDVESAERGIVYIDEIDKKCKRNASNASSKDVSGEGVQQALLKLIEGTTVSIPKPNGEKVKVNTNNILFIVGGSFVDLYNKATKSSIGFTGQSVNQTDELTTEDLIEYGLIPEFVGRFPTFAVLESLDKDMLVDIMTKPKDCIVKQYESLFLLDEVDLQFSKEYLENIATQALNKKTGARGLRNVIERDLLNLQFTLPELKESGVTKVQINENGKASIIN